MHQLVCDVLSAYLNLWDAREHPRGALISALARAASPRGFSALIKKLKAPLKKVKASAKVSGIAELVVKLEYGHYQIQDEGFVEWLRQLELEE